MLPVDCLLQLLGPDQRGDIVGGGVWELDHPRQTPHLGSFRLRP